MRAHKECNISTMYKKKVCAPVRHKKVPPLRARVKKPSYKLFKKKGTYYLFDVYRYRDKFLSNFADNEACSVIISLMLTYALHVAQ